MYDIYSYYSLNVVICWYIIEHNAKNMLVRQKYPKKT